MEQYDKNVNIILEFLVAEKFSASVISLHRLYYKDWRKNILFFGRRISMEQRQQSLLEVLR